MLKILTTLRIPDHFNAAAVAGLQRRLVSGQRGVVEGVLTPGVRPAVTLVAVYRSCWKQFERTIRVFFAGVEDLGLGLVI